MPIYNPTDANFLTVAQSRTNNGQKDVRVLLDITSNIFYTLDDDGNLEEIQSSGGGEDLEQTLTNGNFTGNENIIMSSGTFISGETDATLYTTDGDTTANISSISNGFITYNQFLVDMPSTGENSLIEQKAQEIVFQVETNNKFTIDGRTNTLTNENFILSYPLPSNPYLTKRTVIGGLNDFYTSDGIPTTLGKIEPRVTITNVKVKISAYDAQNYLGYYNEITAAFKLDSFGDYQVINLPNEIGFSDFTYTTSTLVANGTEIQVIVTGEGVGFDIGWVAEIEYSDY